MPATPLDRRTFLKTCAALGLTVPLIACGSSESTAAVGPVLIIGAGAAGMSAGHLLAQRGVDFRILEAAPSYGGRIKHTRDFVDFPIPLGGEWLHGEPDDLVAIVNDDSVEIPTRLVGYERDDSAGFFDDELTIEPMGIYEDLKFVGSSWLGFFETLIVPGITDRMTFGTQIVRIDSTGDAIVATDAAGATYEAAAVIVTVPITILRDGDIEFVPPLPDTKVAALDEAKVWGGMKVFVEFSEQFYPATLEFDDSITVDGQRLYYDAAHGQESDKNVIGLFSVGAQAEPYQQRTGDELRDYVLAELDEIFDGAATRTYVQHLAQNWDEEPFIRQAYLADNALSKTPRILAEPIDGRIFFAGDAYTQFDDWSEVHLAAQSARDTVADLLA